MIYLTVPEGGVEKELNEPILSSSLDLRRR